MLKHVQIALVAFVLLAGTALVQAVLNNDSIKMSKAGFGDDVIVSDGQEPARELHRRSRRGHSA